MIKPPPIPCVHTRPEILKNFIGRGMTTEAITATIPADGVYNWGRGKHKILAQEDPRDFKSARKVPLPETEDFVSVSSGRQHTVALTSYVRL